MINLISIISGYYLRSSFLNISFADVSNYFDEYTSKIIFLRCPDYVTSDANVRIFILMMRTMAYFIHVIRYGMRSACGLINIDVSI